MEAPIKRVRDQNKPAGEKPGSTQRISPEQVTIKGYITVFLRARRRFNVQQRYYRPDVG